MHHLDATLAPLLAEREAQNLYRRRLSLESAQGPLVRVDGRELINFCANDYLGLAAHPALAQAMAEAATRWGTGSGASHLVCGHSAEHEALEQELADWLGRPRALLFSTGFMANLGTIQALVGSGDAVFEDRLNHASLLDGGLASGARFGRYAHNDTAALAAKLAASEAPRKLVVTDGVFSMDGDCAPLPELARLCAEHQAWLMVDDAHGLGVLGEQGRGCTDGLSTEEVPVLMATLGKALGGFGAFVAGSETLIEYLIQHARPYIYTTALPPAVAAANRAALSLARGPEGEARRGRLRELIARFKAGAAQLGLALMPSDTAIQPLLVGDSAAAMALSTSLREAGFLVGAIRPPTVPAGTARLRITLSAGHTAEQVDRLLGALAELAKP
ncbi:MAG: 8-amino-7-oxononanoate synthase [Gammaproteobacteria bacterium]|nr:8-amino-7-oxononanoate synthase [Gammaproteobacteria bacterium]